MKQNYNLSEQIKLTFENVQKIYGETSKLLLDTSALIEGDDYYCDHGNTLGAQHSKHIEDPDSWITPYAARYFVSRKDLLLQIGVAVVFLGRNHQPVEPIVLYGVTRYIQGKGRVTYNVLRHIWYNLLPGQEFGKEYLVTSGLESINLQSAIVVGKDVTLIKNVEDANSEIVKPLLDLVKKQ